MIHLDGTSSERECHPGSFRSDSKHEERCPRTMLSSKVIRTLERYRMVRPGDSVLVALSGGADSVALTALLYELQHRSRHLDLPCSPEPRPARGGRRRRGVLPIVFRETFASFRVESRRRRRRVPEGTSDRLEDEGRRARYQFLEARAKELGATANRRGSHPRRPGGNVSPASSPRIGLGAGFPRFTRSRTAESSARSST